MCPAAPPIFPTFPFNFNFLETNRVYAFSITAVDAGGNPAPITGPVYTAMLRFDGATRFLGSVNFNNQFNGIKTVSFANPWYIEGEYALIAGSLPMTRISGRTNMLHVRPLGT